MKARRMGHTTFQAALVIGVDPAIAYTCPILVPDGTNDFEVVGGMRGAALELVRCKTIDVEVPAHAELVFELEVDFTQEVFRRAPWGVHRILHPRFKETDRTNKGDHPSQ